MKLADRSDGEREISSPEVFGSQPVVSVLMLAYNHGEYLQQAIEGVLAQKAGIPIELLIGEDCSTDNTLDIALRHQRENPGIVRVITSARNVGSSRNYRRALVAARGEFIAHMDGDDYWLPNKLARQVEFLRANPDCAAVYTNALTIDHGGKRIGLFNDVGNARFDLAAMLRRGNFLNNSSVLFRATMRPCLLEIDEPSIDYMGHLRLARCGFLAQIGEPLTVYRASSSGSMVARNNDRVREMYWNAIQSVPRESVSDDDFAHGIADFMRRVLFRALATRDGGLLRNWWPRIRTASPYGFLRTSSLVAASAARIGAKLLAGWLARASGSCPRVLYRR